MTQADDGRSLVGGKALLERPDPTLVTAPPVDRRLLVRLVEVGDAVSLDPGAWLLGVHGGAGVSSLLRAGVPGRDAGRTWPATGPVVLVARSTTHGLERARDAARQHASGSASPEALLVGLVVVAAAPGRTPPRIASLLDLVSGAYPRVWEVSWVEEWRLAGHDEALPTPPAVRHLHEDLQALTSVGTTPQSKE